MATHQPKSPDAYKQVDISCGANSWNEAMIARFTEMLGPPTSLRSEISEYKDMHAGLG